MKKILMMVLVAGIAMQTNAQWNNWHTTQAISGGVGILGSIIASSERKKAMEIFEREKTQFQSSFARAYDEAKELEADGHPENQQSLREGWTYGGGPQHP